MLIGVEGREGGARDRDFDYIEVNGGPRSLIVITKQYIKPGCRSDTSDFSEA